MFALMANAADKVTITVKNTIADARKAEMVEVSAQQIIKKLDGEKTFIVTDADGNEIPSQITYDGKLIFQTDVASKGKTVYYANLIFRRNTFGEKLA